MTLKDQESWIASRLFLEKREKQVTGRHNRGIHAVLDENIRALNALLMTVRTTDFILRHNSDACELWRRQTGEAPSVLERNEHV